MAIVAVNVTDWPFKEGLGADVNPIVVAALFTVREAAGEVLTPKFASPA